MQRRWPIAWRATRRERLASQVTSIWLRWSEIGVTRQRHRARLGLPPSVREVYSNIRRLACGQYAQEQGPFPERMAVLQLTDFYLLVGD
jgi:hypothetical protein